MTLAAWLAMYVGLFAMLLPVFICAAIGAALGLRKRAYPSEFISVLVTSVTTPALVFHTLLTTRLSDALLLQVGSATMLGLAFTAVLGAAALRLAKLPVKPLLPTVTFPNSANLGLPVAQLAFGDTGLAVAIVVYAACSLAQHTLGVWMLSRGADGKPTAWPRGVALACLMAIAIRTSDLALPAPLLESARLIGSLTVPLMLISLGYALVTVSRAGARGGALVGVMRMTCGAVAAFSVVSLLDLPLLVGSVVLLEFMMPVAVVNYLYAARFTRFGDIAAGAVLISTLLFVVLSPLFLWLVGGTGGSPP